MDFIEEAKNIVGKGDVFYGVIDYCETPIKCYVIDVINDEKIGVRFIYRFFSKQHSRWIARMDDPYKMVLYFKDRLYSKNRSVIIDKLKEIKENRDIC